MLQGCSTLETLLQKQLDISSLRVLDFACYPYLRPYNTNKFDFHTTCYVYLGPFAVHRGYRCLMPSGKIVISRHVIFNEELFPFKQGFGYLAGPTSVSVGFSDRGPNVSSWFGHLSLTSHPANACQPNNSTQIPNMSAPILDTNQTPLAQSPIAWTPLA